MGSHASTTITKSIWHHTLRRYAPSCMRKPYASTLRNISQVKTARKAHSHASRKAEDGSSGDCIPSVAQLAMMVTNMNGLKNRHSTNSIAQRRTGWLGRMQKMEVLRYIWPLGPTTSDGGFGLRSSSRPGPECPRPGVEVATRAMRACRTSSLQSSRRWTRGGRTIGDALVTCFTPLFPKEVEKTCPEKKSLILLSKLSRLAVPDRSSFNAHAHGPGPTSGQAHQHGQASVHAVPRT
jgi:hypothetical protein